MTAIRKIIQAVRSSRRSGGASARPERRRARITMEHLDHRQLMSVNFTGNVVTDFPESTSPGVVVLQPDPDDPNFKIPQIPPEPPELRDFIRVSGLQLDAIRVSYDSEEDIFSVGLQQPDNTKTGQPVIAGDTDNNLNGATVAPEIQALPVFFEDPGLLGGSETMFISIDFLNDDIIGDPATMTDNIVAGITNGIDPDTGQPLPKGFMVAEFSADPLRSSFGAMLPEFIGASFLSNTPEAPNFEFEIRNFSELFERQTGMPLTSASDVQISAFADSGQDDGISEAQIPPLELNIGDATVPEPPPPPPPPPPMPKTPTTLINPHEDRIVNTAHDTIVRVYILGSDTFDVSQIVPESVRLGGATPIRPPFFARQNHDSHLDATFFFRGNDIDLPAGRVDAPVTGVLEDGTEFRGSAQIVNVSRAFFSPVRETAQRVRTSLQAGFQNLTDFEQRLRHRIAQWTARSERRVERIESVPDPLTNPPLASRNPSDAAPVSVSVPIRPAVPPIGGALRLAPTQDAPAETSANSTPAPIRPVVPPIDQAIRLAPAQDAPAPANADLWDDAITSIRARRTAEASSQIRLQGGARTVGTPIVRVDMGNDADGTPTAGGVSAR